MGLSTRLSEVGRLKARSASSMTSATRLKPQNGVMTRQNQQQLVDGGHVSMCQYVDQKRHDSIQQKGWEHTAEHHTTANVVFTRMRWLQANLGKSRSFCCHFLSSFAFCSVL